MQRFLGTVVSLFLVMIVGCMGGEGDESELAGDGSQGFEELDPDEGALLVPPLVDEGGDGADEGEEHVLGDEPELEEELIGAPNPGDDPPEEAAPTDEEEPQEEAEPEEEPAEEPEEEPEEEEPEEEEQPVVEPAGNEAGSCDPDPGDRCEICACESCAQNVDECMSNEACAAVVDCARRTECDGFGCLLECGAEIDEAGGVFSDPVQNAQALGDCRDAHCANEC